MHDITEAPVALTRCPDYSTVAEAIARQFELLGGPGKFVSRGDTVLLKPNFISPRPRRCATQTDPAVIIETAKLVKDFGAKPFVGDSPAWGNVFTCAKALEIEEPLRKLDVPVKQLNKPRRCQIGNATVAISSVALDADVIINLPKFKTHQQLVATFAVKNMFGCVSGKWKPYWHFARGKNEKKFCKFLIEIYKFLNPALTIIDAVTAMDGPGPIRGRARPLGWLIGGTEPITLEYTCCKLISLSPDKVPIIRTAGEIGFGCRESEKIQIVGDPLPQQSCTDFIPAELVPIRFSLLHVCKSVCKQVVLLAKSGFSSPQSHEDTK
jgi:uncharacterized protein (DUF362 family)